MQPHPSRPAAPRSLRRRPAPRRAAGLAFALGHLACAPGAGPEAAKAGDPATAVPRLDRIVSLGGAVTETVFALGAGDRVVAVDGSSTWPETARTLPQVGYVRATAAEPILAQRPSLVLASDDLGPPGVAEQLRAAGIPVHLVSSERSVAGARARIADLGALLGAQEAAKRVGAALDGALAQAQERCHPGVARPSVLALYARGGGTQLVAGRGTGPDELLTLACARNAAGGVDGYQPLTAEAVLLAAPEVVLLPAAGAASLGERGIAALPGFDAPGITPPRPVTLDDGLLLSFGPRTGEAALALFDLLHPAPGRP